MELIIDKAVGWLVPFVLGAAVGGVGLWFGMLRAVRDGLQSLLRAEIIRQNEKWTGLSYCPVYAKEALTREYRAYHGLKGNDVGTALYEEVMELPESPAERSKNES